MSFLAFDITIPTWPQWLLRSFNIRYISHKTSAITIQKLDALISALLKRERKLLYKIWIIISKRMLIYDIELQINYYLKCSPTIIWIVCLGIISIVLVCDEYHREDGIVRNALYARTAVRGRPAVPIQTEIVLRNGNTNIKRARKILEYMSRRSVYHVRSKYIVNYWFFKKCWALIAW